MPFSFNAVVLCVVTINDKRWARGKDVFKALRYEKAARRIVKHHCTIKNIQHKHQLVVVHAAYIPINWQKDSQKFDAYIKEEGMIELLIGSQQPMAKELAEYMSIKLIGHKYVRKEADTIYTIQKVFEGISMKRQFSIGSYRIDLCFTEHKLATECDKYNHKGRGINYEIRRQKFIEDHLSCNFFRYNPDAKDFMNESVLNKIFQYIYQKRSSQYLDIVLWPSSQTVKYRDNEEKIFMTHEDYEKNH